MWDRSKHRERWFFVLSRAWDKEKFLILMRNRTSDLRIPRSNALPLSHWVTETCFSNWKHPWSVQRNKIRPANSVSLVFGMSWRHEKKPYLDFPFSLTFFPRYLLIFLKFVQAVIPTIEYDYTRHFTMWSWTKSTELNLLTL